jgi:hypothetical protein
MRSRIADILLSEQQVRGFSQEERDLMKRIVEGTPFQNTVRTAGNILGGGGGLLAAGYGVAGALSHGAIALAPVVGYGLKKLQNFMTARDVGHLNEVIRSNSPLGRQMASVTAAWGNAVKAHEAATSPRTTAALAIASRNLIQNLRDAGVQVREPNPAGAE